LPRETWLLFLIWSIIGFSIYALYGYRNSRMRANGK
jgi:APA family basic amino acid/polyamine antiporter